MQVAGLTLKLEYVKTKLNLADPISRFDLSSLHPHINTHYSFPQSKLFSHFAHLA